MQPEMRLAYWGLMASASPGEKLVSIKDNFKGFGEEAGRWNGDISAPFLCFFVFTSHFLQEKLLPSSIFSSGAIGVSWHSIVRSQGIFINFLTYSLLSCKIYWFWTLFLFCFYLIQFIPITQTLKLGALRPYLKNICGFTFSHLCDINLWI